MVGSSNPRPVRQAILQLFVYEEQVLEELLDDLSRGIVR